MALSDLCKRALAVFTIENCEHGKSWAVRPPIVVIAFMAQLPFVAEAIPEASDIITENIHEIRDNMPEAIAWVTEVLSKYRSN